MGITTKKPPMKETVGAQYICFVTQTEDGDWQNKFDANVEKTEVVKKIKVSENMSSEVAYASGVVYDSDSTSGNTMIEVEVIAFPADTLAKMRGEKVDVGGLILSGAGGSRPYFAYGKVVKLKRGKIRMEWYPKCKLTENSDEASTKTEKFAEQTDTVKISAYPFDAEGNIKAYVDSSVTGFPEGLTEEKFFAKPILTVEDLKTAAGVALKA